MKKNIYNIFTIIALLFLFSGVFLMAQVYVNPYSRVNPFPPPTVPAIIVLPTYTSTLARLPATWTVTPFQESSVVLKPSSTPWLTSTRAYYFVIKSATPTPTVSRTPTNTKLPTRTVTKTRTSAPTSTILANKTSTNTVFVNTPTPSRTATVTRTSTQTGTATPTGSATATSTGTGTATPTGTATATPTGTFTVVPTVPSDANIAFNMDYDGDGYQDLLLLTEDGSTVWPVLYGDGSRTPSFCDWTTDGQWLLYYDTGGPIRQLYRIQLNGSNDTYISRQGYGNNLNGDYSSDGSMIVFQRDYGAAGRIYTMPADGSVSSSGSGFYGLWPRWSPDGSTVIYQKVSGDLYSLNGGSEVQLTDDSDEQAYPNYVTGSQIVYSQSNGSQWDVYSGDTGDLSSATNLSNSAASETFPSLAPGSRIIYLVDGQTVAVMNLDGSGQTVLYNGPRTISNPRWK